LSLSTPIPPVQADVTSLLHLDAFAAKEGSMEEYRVPSWIALAVLGVSCRYTADRGQGSSTVDANTLTGTCREDATFTDLFMVPSHDCDHEEATSPTMVQGSAASPQRDLLGSGDSGQSADSPGVRTARVTFVRSRGKIRWLLRRRRPPSI